MVSGSMFQWLPSVNLPDGVELFFVLSGFLIGTILIRTLEEKERLGWADLTNFWKRRWFRTLPNYYLILAVNYWLVSSQIINGDIEQFDWKFLFFMHNLYEGFYLFFWESWSLSVEEWFYLILPILIIIFRLVFDKKTTLLLAIAVMIIVPITQRIIAIDNGYDDFWFGVEVRKVVLLRLDTIIYGVLAAYVAYYFPKIWHKSRWIAFFVGMALMITVMKVPHPINTYYGNVFYFILISFAAMLMLPLASSFKANPFGKIGNSITFISKISYSMYLVNHALVVQVIVKNFPPKTLEQNWLAYTGFWMATIIISTILYRFYEKPMMKLRDKF